ncbi:hypothetical protein D1F64_06245 [Breoghania sp. L-A4]|nr:hypothetical protein D1F64_06245 [Breoghania sp. L-A4]
MVLAVTLAAIVISGDAAGAGGTFWVAPPGRIILAETRDECIMRCVANRDLCERSCSDQFDQCVANGGDDGSCGEIFRACHAECGAVGFNRCVTEQCYTLPN